MVIANRNVAFTIIEKTIMNVLKKLGCAAAIALSANAVQASPIMNDWFFNPAGTGKVKSQPINEYLDVNGNAFIQITPTRGGSFSFTDHAVFNLSQADSNGKLFPMKFGGAITATLDGYGTGTFGGTFSFTGGTISMYHNTTYGAYDSTAGIYGANLGQEIARFSVLTGGGGSVDAKGNPVDNGQVSVWAESVAGTMKSGYFFNDRGIDMSGLSNTAFAFTNANTVGKPTANMIGEIACQFAGFTGPGCTGGTYATAPGSHFFIGGNGQFKFAEVPEPGSVALFGIALFGIGAMRRRMK